MPQMPGTSAGSWFDPPPDTSPITPAPVVSDAQAELRWMIAKVAGKAYAVSTSKPAWNDVADALLSGPIAAMQAEHRREVERLHERLEDNHAFDMDGNRIECEPGSVPDGITCRDETIKLQDERLAAMQAEHERVVLPLQDALDVLDRPLYRALEAGFRHSPLTAKEREQRLRETCEIAAELVRAALASQLGKEGE